MPQTFATKLDRSQREAFNISGATTGVLFAFSMLTYTYLDNKPFSKFFSGLGPFMLAAFLYLFRTSYNMWLSYTDEAEESEAFTQLLTREKTEAEMFLFHELKLDYDLLDSFLSKRVFNNLYHKGFFKSEKAITAKLIYDNDVTGLENIFGALKYDNSKYFWCTLNFAFRTAAPLCFPNLLQFAYNQNWFNIKDVIDDPVGSIEQADKIILALLIVFGLWNGVKTFLESKASYEKPASPIELKHTIIKAFYKHRENLSAFKNNVNAVNNVLSLTADDGYTTPMLVNYGGPGSINS